MRNSLILASCALCVVIISAVPLPSADKELEVVQIPLQGNKEIDILSLPENANGQLTERNKRTIGILRELFPELSRATTLTAAATSDNDEPSVDLAALSERLDSINRVVRNTQSQQSQETAAALKAIDNVSSLPAVAASSTTDTHSSASEITESKAPAIDELTLDDEENDENRNKRFLSFGLSGNSGGSGGSGNFLFDIIRLVGGSAGTEQTDEKENAPDGEVGTAKQGDGYTEGIPGPVTRLFVLANRGLANLIQDLILRIAQTSERVVNFKARLITSLI